MNGLSTDALIRAALDEDVGPGDFTSLWTVPAAREVEATLIAKGQGTLAGVEVARRVFAAVDDSLQVAMRLDDMAAVSQGDEVMRVAGRARSILTAERVALNFLQRLSGVATVTRRYVDAVAGTGARILDTRKTTPGMRALEKSAVRAGGGENHRFGLHDMVLIKENHVAAAGGISAAVNAVVRQNDRGLRVEVETRDLEEVREALEAGVDRILFDHMSFELLREAVTLVASSGRMVETEASGEVTLLTVREIARTGVDYISVGALTHSAPALDLSLLIEL